MKTALKYWLVLAIMVSGLSGLVYAAIQQNIRIAANDPQIQMAEDAATKLANGQSVQQVIPADRVDIARSLAPYIIVYDASGKPLASTALLNGQVPTIPVGVFDEVRHNQEDRITWQPQSGVRSAVVVTQFKGATPGFVLVGRSIREVEQREDDIRQLVMLGWLALLMVSFLATLLLFRRSAKGG